MPPCQSNEWRPALVSPQASPLEWRQFTANVRTISKRRLWPQSLLNRPFLVVRDLSSQPACRALRGSKNGAGTTHSANVHYVRSFDQILTPCHKRPLDRGVQATNQRGVGADAVALSGMRPPLLSARLEPDTSDLSPSQLSWHSHSHQEPDGACPACHCSDIRQPTMCHRL